MRLWSTQWLPRMWQRPQSSLEARRRRLQQGSIQNMQSSREHTVVAIAVETLGPINSEGLAFITELGRRLSNASGDTREARFLFQSLSVTVQRYNAVAFQGTFSGLLVAEWNP